MHTRTRTRTGACRAGLSHAYRRKKDTGSVPACESEQTSVCSDPDFSHRQLTGGCGGGRHCRPLTTNTAAIHWQLCCQRGEERFSFRAHLCSGKTQPSVNYPYPSTNPSHLPPPSFSLKSADFVYLKYSLAFLFYLALRTAHCALDACLSGYFLFVVVCCSSPSHPTPHPPLFFFF